MIPAAGAVSRFDPLEGVVAAAVARCVEVPGGVVAPDAALSLLGLDSLAAITLSAELEAAVGCPVPPELVQECENVRSIARRLGKLRIEHARSGSRDPYEQMVVDAELPGDVRPASTEAREADFRSARSILLSGATGFLGAALARELLTMTAARLVCLARPGASGSGAERVRRALAGAGLGAEVLRDRVRVIEGDLARPRLGLDASRLDALAADVDAICHAAASVNWVYSYAALRSSNVLGTLELLRLACGDATRCLPFHFVSSLSACHSSAGPRTVDERFDALPYLRGVHLGYAQTKIVGEALVRQAAERGLPVRIYRPGLISGHSITGAFNRDDLLSALVRGCVHMGAAPDLDWQLDVLPVDFVSRAIVHLSSAPGPLFHLRHRRPRHWREVVLWMRLYGYPLRLVPYHAWLRQLEEGTVPTGAGTASHPLRSLRSFFLDRPRGEGGLTLPELYEESRQASVGHEYTSAALNEKPLGCPPLDTSLLDTYFRAFVTSGTLPPPRAVPMRGPAVRASARVSFDASFFRRLLPDWDVRRVTSLEHGSDHSIISELVAWRCTQPTGLFRFRLDLNGPAGPATRDVVLKVKPVDRDVMAVGDALAHLCNPAIGEAYTRWQDRLGLCQGHVRELAILGQTDPRFVRHAPQVLGIHADPTSGTWLVALENLGDDARLMNAHDRPQDWTPGAIALAIDGLAALQSIWFTRETELRAMPWIGHVQSAGSMEEMSDLWNALAHHAAPAFSSWADPSITAIHRRLVAHVGRWWAVIERGPRTLIHHDFNPRNVCLRGDGDSLRLCAYDWELAAIGSPQRDLVEFLCFVLPPDVTREDAEYWIWRHRDALARESGLVISDSDWDGGVRAALGDVLINRFAMYALIHRIRRQRSLPRVVRTWRRLYGHFPLELG